MFVIGLDVGTSGVKSTVFDGGARVVSDAYNEYDLITEKPGQFELNPNELLDKSVRALGQSIEGIDKRKVKSICVTSFGESFVCLDAQDQVLSNTMIYMDTRGQEETAAFAQIASKKEIAEISGQFLDPMFGMYKLRWMQNNHPKIMDQTEKICFVADFITYMLGADHMCDYSLASRSGMLNIREKKWWDIAVNFAEIEQHKLPKPILSGSRVGTINATYASKLGVGQEVELVVGGHDQIMAAYGSGAIHPGDVANGMGTVDCMTPVMEATNLDMDKLIEYKLPIVPYLTEDTYITMAFSMSGGAVVKWFRDVLAQDVVGTPDAYNRLNKEMPDAPTDLLVIPYFGGGATPAMDATTPASIAGLRLDTKRGEIFKALMEGESFEVKRGLNSLKQAGVPIERIIAVGGGSQSKNWMQIRADIFDQTIYTAKNMEAGTLASAMACYVNLGEYSNAQEATQELTSIKDSFSPSEYVGKYRQKFERHMDYYRHMQQLYTK